MVEAGLEEVNSRRMRSLAPHPTLAPCVRDIVIVEVGDEVQRLRMPEPGLLLAVRYRGFASIGLGAEEERIPGVSLTGMAVRARSMRTSAGGGAVLVRFQPCGAAQFFREPLHELFEATTALSTLAPQDVVSRMHDRVSSATKDSERAQAVEEFLFSQRREQSDPIMAHAAQRLGAAEGAEPIRALAARVGLSLDAFEKRFRRVVGCSPKEFASLCRLRRAIDSYRPGVSLTQIALDAGYHDQSHFNRALRSVTGRSPGQFFQLKPSER